MCHNSFFVSSYNHFAQQMKGLLNSSNLTFCAVLKWASQIYGRLFIPVWTFISHNYPWIRLVKITHEKKMFEVDKLWEVLVNIVWLKQCVSNYYCGLQSTTLTLHYSGRQLRMNFISTVAQWDKFFVFLLCIRFFLFGSCLIFGELWHRLCQGSLFQNCSISDQCLSCHKLSKHARLTGFPKRIVLFHKLHLL